MASRSLAAQRQGAEVAGHNLANVNNPSYARQRVVLSASAPIHTSLGSQGTGAEANQITQFRSNILDRQIQNESSVRSSLESQQTGLEMMQSGLGQAIDRQATGAEGTAAASGTGGQRGIAEDLSDFFNGFQSLSTNPTSMAERQVLLMKSANLSTQFNAVATRLEGVSLSLDDRLRNDVSNANLALQDIARLNEQIVGAEVGGRVTANDLRDARQQRIEDLSKLLKVETTETETGSVSVSAGGTELVTAYQVVGPLEVFDSGGGKLLTRVRGEPDALNVAGGSIHGILAVRDGELATLREDLETLAGHLIVEVNRLHKAGYDLKGGTGKDFFVGSSASDIGVNQVLMRDPSQVQAAGVAGAVGDNQVALSLAQLGDRKIAALHGQSFSERYGQSVSEVGQALSSVNTQLDNQNVVERMLLSQRDSLGGVSLDEEMMDIVKFQKAFDASAKLIVTISEMLDTVINLKR